MTDDDPNEIDKLLQEIRKKIVEQTTIEGTTTTWDMGDSMNYKDTMIDTSHWTLNPTTYNYVTTPTLQPLTATQIHNMGIGTTGSSAGWATTNTFTFDLEKSHNKEFETHMPGIHKINQMREMFPGFKKAWDHMRTVYDLVHEEYLERKKEI